MSSILSSQGMWQTPHLWDLANASSAINQLIGRAASVLPRKCLSFCRAARAVTGTAVADAGRVLNTASTSGTQNASQNSSLRQWCLRVPESTSSQLCEGHGQFVQHVLL